MREADIWKVLSRPKRSQIPKQARGLPSAEEFLDKEITQRLKKEQLEQEREDREKKKILGRRLRSLRMWRHNTQAEIGDMSDIEKLTISKYERGLVAIPPDDAELLADILGCDPEYLTNLEATNDNPVPDRYDEICDFDCFNCSHPDCIHPKPPPVPIPSRYDGIRGAKDEGRLRLFIGRSKAYMD